MANKNKISGSISGNKLNISISTNNENNSSNNIESSANKVKSIAEISSKENKSQNTLNKKQVLKKENSLNSSSIQEIEILKNIEKKLQDLNNNIIKIQFLKNNVNNKFENNVKEPEKNLFDSKFVEGTTKSFITLFDNSNFRTKFKSILSEIYDESTLLKVENLDSFKSDISEIISSSSYTIQNSEKAVDQEKYVNLSNETINAINQRISESNNAIETGSSNDIEKINDSLKLFTDKIESSLTLNTNTNDSQQNAINELLKEISEKVSKENEKNEKTQINITQQFNENDKFKEIGEQISLILNESQNTSKQLDKENKIINKEDLEFNDQLFEKLDILNDTIIENKESIDEILDDLDDKKENDDKFHQEKIKLINEDKGIKNSINNVISKNLSPELNKKNIKEPISPLNRLHPIKNNDNNKNFEKIQEKKTSIKIIENKSREKETEEKKVFPIILMKEQKTVSNKEPISPLKNLEKNSKTFLMSQDMKKIGSINSGNNKNPMGELLKISAILNGFTIFYKNFALRQEERELYKLRFDNDDKSKDNISDKILNFFKFKRNNESKSIIKNKKSEKDNESGFIGDLISLIGGGLLKIFKLNITGKITSLTKMLSGGFLKLITSTGKFALNGINWTINLLKTSIGKIFSSLIGKISSLSGKVFSKITNVLGSLSSKLIGSFRNVFGGIFGKAASLIGNIFGKLGRCI